MTTRKMPVTPEAISKFQTKVQKSSDDECWMWLGTRVRSGHGQFSFGGARTPSHRFAMRAAGKELPDDLLACHKCNNPSCVNPNHLYAGTPKDNAWDAIRAGTFRFTSPGRGEDHANAKLTKESVKYALEMKRLGVSLRKLAKILGVSASALSKAWRGETWA